MSNTYIIILAHESKTDDLVKHALNSIPKDMLDCVYVITNTDVIIDLCINENIKYTKIPDKYVIHNSSLFNIVDNFLHNHEFNNSDTIVVLPLVHTDRTWQDVLNAILFMQKNKASSLLCSKKITGTHPYQCMFKIRNIYGQPVCRHNKLKTDDYPEVFEISHNICIFKTKELQNLNYNMYNDKTVFYSLDSNPITDVAEFTDNVSVAFAKTDESDVIECNGTSGVIVFGNDKNLLNININNMPTGYKTIGINRSWLHMHTDYLFFNDMSILIELIRSGKHENDLKHMDLIASDWLIETAKRNNQFHILKPYMRKNIVRIFDRVDRTKFPDSVTTALEIFNKYIYQSTDVNYFIAATSLTYDDKKNHFWSNDYSAVNSYDKKWYDEKFPLILNNFNELKKQDYKIYSVSKDSKINDVFEYIPFDKLNLVKFKQPDKPLVEQEKQLIQPDTSQIKTINTAVLIKNSRRSRVFIVGGGASLKDFDFSLLKNEDVIAVNKAIEFVPYAKHFITMDYTFIHSHDKLKNADFNIIKKSAETSHFVVNTLHDYMIRIDGVYTDTRYNLKYKDLDKFDDVIVSNTLYDSINGFGKDISNFAHGNNSGFCALQLALILGYDKIYLMGYDLNTNSRKTHFHNGYNQDYARFTKELADYRSTFEAAIRLSDNKDRIISCSPISSLNSIIKYVGINTLFDNQNSLNDLIVIGYYTINTPYEQEAKGLINSCKKLHLNQDIVGIPNMGNWQSNTRFKARFMLDMLRKYPGKKLLYVDCDAVIHSKPILFINYECDIAVRYQDFRWRKDECLSGTIFINSNERTIKLCEKWIQINDAEGPHAKTMEQWNLDAAIKDGIANYNLILEKLPPEYTFIFDTMKAMYPDVKPIIEHFQASRRFRNKV